MAGREAAGEEEAGDSWPGWPVWFFFCLGTLGGDGRTFQIEKASNDDVLRHGGGGGGHIWAGD